MANIFKITKGDKAGSLGLLLKIAIPLIITTSSASLMEFTDRMFLSWYSSDALAACLPAGLISFSIVAFFMGTCGYTSVFVANYYGQKRYASLSVALWQGVLVGVLFGFIIAALVPLGLILINLSSHAPEVKLLEKQYFTILTLFGGFAVVSNALAGFFSGQGKTGITMAVNITGNLINIPLTYAMVFGKWGLPEMGIKGAAWSTIISGFIVILIFFAIIFNPKINKKFRLGKLFGFNKKAAWRLIKYGLPNGFGFAMDIFSFSVFAFFTGNIDKISLAASNIVLTLQMIVFMPLMGLAVATQILMGQYVGMKKPDLGVKTTMTALKTGTVYVLLINAAFLLFPHFFTGFFEGNVITQDMALIQQQTVPLLQLLCLFTWGDLTYLCFGDAIRGAGDTKFHMQAMVFCSLLLIAGSWFIIGVLGKGIVAAWTWITVYSWLTGIFMGWRFFSGKWRNIDITK